MAMIFDNGNMEMAALDFVGAIKNSPEFRQYEMQLLKIKKQPELYQEVNEFRQKNFVVQNTEDKDTLMDRIDELAQEYEQLRENPLVEDFMEAEISFCRMMQEVNTFITKELNFQ